MAFWGLVLFDVVDGWARMSKKEILEICTCSQVHAAQEPQAVSPWDTHKHTRVHTHTHTHTHRHTLGSISICLCFYLSLFIYIRQRSKVALDRKLSQDAAADKSAVSCKTQRIHVTALIHWPNRTRSRDPAADKTDISCENWTKACHDTN